MDGLKPYEQFKCQRPRGISMGDNEERAHPEAAAEAGSTQGQRKKMGAAHLQRSATEERERALR